MKSRSYMYLLSPFPCTAWLSSTISSCLSTWHFSLYLAANLDNSQHSKCSFGSVGGSTDSNRHMTSYASVENLMANMTLNARIQGDMALQPSEIMIVHDPDLDKQRAGPKAVQRSRSQRSQVTMRRSVSSASVMNSKKVETVFGVENNVTCTRWYENSQGEWMPESDEVFEMDSGRHSAMSNYSVPFNRGTRGSCNDLQVHGKAAHRTVCDGSESSRQRADSSFREDKDRYGYTVVLSSAPRVEVKGPGLAWQHTTTCSLEEQPDHYSSNNWGGSCGSLASAKSHTHIPPPYMPPPSYSSTWSLKSVPVQAPTFRSRGKQFGCGSYQMESSKSPPGERWHSASPLCRYSVPHPRDGISPQPALARMRSGASLTESYRMAIDGNVSNAACTPVGRSLYATTIKRCESSPGKAPITNKTRQCVLLMTWHRSKSF